ncbi:alpha/beta-hydrolase [Xylariaceae sp. FL0662B]|nr:alpha/beta-hydrolase [Xylariaceae sp. FL0662B]
MAAEAATAGGTAPEDDEVKPYRIHVSSKYLDLTKQKLELTRLPHELSEPKSDWWEPKPQVEPLIDFWLEQYSWRTQEDLLNSQLAQFRTSFTIPSSETTIRVHFVHIRSPHSNAVPLLLVPPFPFSNLSLGHLVKPLTDPDDVANNQPFHLVIPSLPGLGFSDAFPNNTPVISVTANILASLMSRLSYSYYLVTNAGSGASSPAEIDYKIVDFLATQHPNACLGVHLISPPLGKPKLQKAPVEWAKWSFASFFRAPILGYHREDFSALKRNGYVSRAKKPSTPALFGLNRIRFDEPNTLAYALCDSPTGLLVSVLKSLRLLGLKKDLTPTEIINFTQLAWLPGPEAAMRFWAYSVQHPEEAKKSVSRPKVGITVFLGNDPGAPEPDGGVDGPGTASSSAKIEADDCYTCPSWANARYHVVYAHRAAGKSGLLAWERPELIAAGIRGLAQAILKTDSRLRPAAPAAVAPLEQVVVHDDAAGTDVTSAPADPSPSPNPALLVPPQATERGVPQREISDDTAIGSSETIPGKPVSSGPATPSPVHLAPPADDKARPQRKTSDDTATSQPEDEKK